MKLLTTFATWIITQGVFAAGISIDPVTGIDAGGSPVTNLPEPLNPSDAATKAYIDDFLSGLTAPAPVPETGQTAQYDANTPQEDDGGANPPGVALPQPRFTDNSDGTLTDVNDHPYGSIPCSP